VKLSCNENKNFAEAKNMSIQVDNLLKQISPSTTISKDAKLFLQDLFDQPVRRTDMQ
jgi:hypothetical protein